MRTVVTPYYTPTGNKVDVIDPYALQTELTALDSTNIGIQSAVSEIARKVEALQAQMDATQMFYGYVASQHPHIIAEYQIREAAKAKVCPPPSLVNADMQELELRTMAAIGKLP
jgi:hypothetical protein